VRRCVGIFGAMPEPDADLEDAPRRFQRALDALARFDGREGVVRAARALRARLPGDHAYGDPLSVAGDEAPQLIGQRLAAATDQRPSAVRELGFGALQLWQVVSEAQGRGRGDEPLAILFTDLVGFSDWALEAGDDAALELLRTVGRTVDPAIKEREGRIVKRLGDGVMAVFDDAGLAVDAALESTRAVREIEVDGYHPELRGGIHFGKPRKLGSDYFGVDVNVAARVADAAGPGEVLISEAVCDQIGNSDMELRRRWRFKAKGAPKDLKVFAAKLEG
jgi:adenylate cyclase